MVERVEAAELVTFAVVDGSASAGLRTLMRLRRLTRWRVGWEFHMTSILLALAAALSWGISDFTGGVLTRRLALAPVLLISQGIGFTMLVLLAALRGPPVLDLRAVVLAVAASAASLVGLGALYRGMAVGVVSIVAPISATGAALPVAFGVLRGERATLSQAVGIGLALIGIVLASRSADRTHDALG